MMKKSCQLMLHLQTGCFRFSESMCPCCNSCYDTIEHFMLHCEALADVRRPLAIFGVGHSMSPLVSMWNTVVRYNMRGSVVKMLGTAQYGSKFSWSKKVKMIVGNSDLQSLRIMCSLYSSLKWYCESLTTTPTLCPTIWWKICQEFPMMKKSCQLMLHLQTGCFRFSESMCPCCNSCYDTIEHFMLHCEALADVRRPLAIFFNEMHLMSNDQKMRMSLGIQVSIDDIDTLVFISGIVTQMYTKRNSLIS
ncbi:unnamed protein product [Owenia fusiformis]|uniref:Uncharacterized protein n=1 Tax=Owenia fusiformis TaxID=6347 RepID=A0A8S4NTW0_OWEFU|nr:unnamed protein product [Owenia fusiformis]